MSKVDVEKLLYRKPELNLGISPFLNLVGQESETNEGGGGGMGPGDQYPVTPGSSEDSGNIG